MSRRLRGRTVLAIWILAGLLLLFWWIQARDQEEAAQAFGWLIILWGLPMSALLTPAFGMLVQLDVLKLSGEAQALLLWCTLGLGGLWQWGWAAPRLSRRLARWLRPKGPHDGRPIE